MFGIDEFSGGQSPRFDIRDPCRGTEQEALYFPSNAPNDTSIEGDDPSNVARGTFLDVTIQIRDPEGRSLVDAVIAEFAAHRELRRKRHIAEVENELRLVGCMLANALRCHLYRSRPMVSYQRKADAGYYKSRNRPTWFSAQAVGRAARLLADVGVVELRVGERGTASSFSATSKLLELTDEHKVAGQSLRKWIPREDLILLKCTKPRAIYDRATRTLVRPSANRIFYEPTSETEAWCDSLTAYNDFVAAQDVQLELPSDLLGRWLEAMSDDYMHVGASLRRPELFRSSLYRVFNDGAPEHPIFKKGGRLVGGWWINTPEEVRRHISINGESVVELDYTACHPRMLYHEKGLEAPADPYEIPAMSALEDSDGRAKGDYRPLVKWLTQILINGRGRPDLVSMPRDMLVPQQPSLRDLCVIIEQAHPAIADAFGSGAGLRLMRTESDIAFRIIEQARANERLVLPIHDSFITQEDGREELEYKMIEEYKKELGFEPLITAK